MMKLIENCQWANCMDYPTEARPEVTIVALSHCTSILCFIVKLSVKKEGLMNLPPSPSEDHFHLMDLPWTPKLLIFKYLERDSLKKMRLTSSSMNDFVNRNKMSLVRREFHVVRIECRKCEYATTYTTTVYKKYFTLRASVNPQSIESTAHLDQYQMICKIMDRDAPPTPSFFPNFAEKFGNSYIGRLEVHGFYFARENVYSLPSLMSKKRIRVKELQIWKVPFVNYNGDSFLRFLTAFKPEALFLDQMNAYSLKTMMDTNFVNVLPRLDLLFINNFSETKPIGLSSDFRPITEKIPREMVSHNAFLTDIEVIKRGIQSWWTNEIDINHYKVSLHDHWTNTTIANAIGLPTTDPKPNRLKYCSPNRTTERTLRVFGWGPRTWIIHPGVLNESHDFY